MEYNPNDIEKRWQEYWEKNKTFATQSTGNEKPKYYVLDMFPYPSGAGLHVGHPLGYIASDIYSRYKRSQGFNVLHPMGYDFIGLPAEQYAIQTGQHPAVTTEQNIKRYREQLDKLGFSFDWDRQVKTSDPSYYKWTQWIFLQLFNSWYNPDTDKAEPIETLIEKFRGLTPALSEGEGAESLAGRTWDLLTEQEQSDILMDHRIAYLGEAYVNWCPALGTVLANDEVKDGVSERGGYPVERKLMKQWSMRITAYADRLLNGLDSIDWTESIKEAQRNWIGKSEGCSIRFNLVPARHSLTPNPSPKERGTERGLYQGYHTAKKEIWDALKSNAKHNRKNQTEAEFILWERVRNNQLGEKIRRQHPIGQFIADFSCLEKKLIIEVDGGYHNEIEQKEYDEGRTVMLEEIGFRLIRFTNEEVIKKTDWVCEQIKTALQMGSTNEELVAPLSFGEGRGEAQTSIEVFTTRPDTLFGITFLTLAPEHDLVSKITTPENKEQVEAYVNYAKNRSERERQAEVKKITGQFTGTYAIHPFTGEEIPVWVGDYVLAGYGTGAVMAVPGGDQRDWSFAKHFGLPIIPVIEGSDIEKEANESKEGKMINSDFLNGLPVKEAIKKIIAEIEARGLGKGKINYRLRDAAFGRQRYWGEPIPIYYKNGIPYPVEEKDLPVVLPEVDKFLPTEDGEPPLARAKDWNYRPHPQPFSEGEGSSDSYPLETTTMPGWAGSSWYYLRYMDPTNDKEFVSKEAADYWKDVDFYLGGSEHATGHLLYVRFWTKFLKDRGFISIEEPAKKLVNQGMIQGRSNFAYSVLLSSISYENGDMLPTIGLPNVFISKEIVDVISTTLDVQLKMSNDDLNKRDEIKNNASQKIQELCKKFTEIQRVKYPNCVGEINMMLLNQNSFLATRVDVNYVENDFLIIDTFKNSRKELSDAAFICENDGQYLCGWEIEKMSKSKWNVVNPDELVEKYGADTLRMYEMFLGPLEQSKPWNTNGITGVSGFLKKFWRLYEQQGPHPQPFSPPKADILQGEGSRVPHTSSTNEESNEELSASLSFGEGRGEANGATKAELKTLHKTIKKITDDIEKLSFNTCVSTFMICVNELTDLKCNKREVLEPLAVLIAPFAPHIAEEIWKNFGHTQSVTFASWPEYKAEYTVENSFSYPVSFNGKTRFFQELDSALSKEDVEKEIMALEQTIKYLEGKQPKKIIVVPKKIVNIVV